MRIKATFVGNNGSCGYVESASYFLRVEQGQDNEIIIDRVDNLGGQCVYETLKSFLNNWNEVTLYSK